MEHTDSYHGGDNSILLLPDEPPGTIQLTDTSVSPMSTYLLLNEIQSGSVHVWGLTCASTVKYKWPIIRNVLFKYYEMII